MLIRDAIEADMAPVQAIYAWHVRHGLASFEEVPPDVGEIARRWRDVLRRGLPYLVAELDRAVVGYAYASLVSQRARPTASRSRIRST